MQFAKACPNLSPDGTLWGFDGHDHIAVRATPDAKELPPWDSGRSFGSVNWDRAGNHYFGEYFIGKEIWKGTTAKFLADGTLGAGHIYKYSPDLKLLQEAALRVGKAAVIKRTVISSSSALSAYVRTALAHEPREQFRVLFLDKRNQLIAD